MISGPDSLCKMAALSFIDMGKQDCTDNEAGLVVNFERIDMGFMLL